MGRAKKRVLLTNLELEVMRCVWDAAERALTVREIAECVNAGRAKELAYTTVQTMLTILRDKGVVRAKSGPGRAFVWQARISEEDARSSLVGDLVERLFDGEVRPLLLHLVEREGLERAELEELRRMIDSQLEDEGAGGSARGGAQ